MVTVTTENAMRAGPDTAATGENGARAALYGVFAHLFADRPSAELLERIAEAGDMIVAEDSILAREWQALCLAAGAVDHFSALCDVMRGLIGESSISEDAVEQQQVFFQHYIAPWHGRLFEKVDKAVGADFYRKVVRVADDFLTHETQYFELA